VMCNALAAAGHRAIGVDLSLGMLQNASTDAPMVQADVLHLPFADESIDGITCGFGLRNFSDLSAFLDELARAVKPGGRIALLDAYRPANAVLRAGHAVYFGKVVPKIGALMSDRDAYQYLPQSLSYMPEPAEFINMVGRAGFSAVNRSTFLGGSAYLVTATRM
jgi:demethylmenaquinone methyltransferase / 2-methoxy-6-polyprenyl-1,4-benzoquinol methylase